MKENECNLNLNLDLTNAFGDGLTLIESIGLNANQNNEVRAENKKLKLDEECKDDNKSLLKELKDQRAKARERMNLLNDFDYFSCIVFQSSEQRDFFIHAMKWSNFGIRYVNGLEICRQMNIRLPSANFSPLPIRQDITLATLTKE